MGLSQALAAAVTGLHASQAGLSIVAGNVANASTPGYVRKSVDQVAVASGGTSLGVRVGQVSRQLNEYVQKQLRTENAGASYADIRAQFYGQLQDIFGQPGSDSSLDSIFNGFTTALQALSASPDDSSARVGVVNSAQQLAQQLNAMSAGVQSLRLNAENGIASAVSSANQLMQKIADLNLQIGPADSHDVSFANLLDQRDSAIDQLSQILDINVVEGANNQISIYTNTGLQLVGLKAAGLAFDAKGSLSASSEWSADPTERGVGTITLTSTNGVPIDLIKTKSIRSGVIAGYLQLRDEDLVQVQNQLDAIASAMSSALSDKTTDGDAITSGGQAGFEVDLDPLLSGNKVTINYTDKLTSTQRTLTFVRVDDPAALPLSNTATIDPNDKVVGIDFSGGMAGVFTQIADALTTTGINSSSSGTMLQILDDGLGGRVAIQNVSTTTTATTFNSGDNEMPFFLDGNNIYSGAFNGAGAQSTGLSGRIAVNGALIADPSKLVIYAAGTPVGDPARPNFILDQLLQTTLRYDPNSGVGTPAAPYQGTLDAFVRQVISQQGEAAANAQTLSQGQQVVLAALQQRFADTSGVNIDTEMTNLLNLQNAYAANARVMSAVKDMFDMLMQM
jgi:flagellar hook-associated protein 1 FlgK